MRAATSTRSRRADVPAEITKRRARFFGIIAIGISALITSIDVSMQFAFASSVGGNGPRALLAVAATFPLHLRHVVFALRGEQPPFAGWTLGALAILHGLAFALVGPPWLNQFASLGISALIVLRGQWALLAAVAITFSPALLLTDVPPHIDAPSLTLAVIYQVLVIVWRSLIQYGPIRLVGAIRELDAARRDFEARAVVRERIRIHTELHNGLGMALSRVLRRSERALDGVRSNAGDAIDDLRELVRDARAALADARRMAASYQAPTVVWSLGAARALIEASGSTLKMITEGAIPLDSADDRFQAALGDALIPALRANPGTAFVLRVRRQENEQLSVAVAADTPARRMEAHQR